MLPYLEQNKDITNFSGYRTKAVAKYFFEIKESEDVEKISEIMDFSKQENLKTLFLGWGRNSLFAFDFFEWIVFKNNLKWFEVKNWILEVNSWESVISLVSKLEKDHWILSLKPWSSLPWTVGGAVVWDAWCFGLEVRDVFTSGKVYDLAENKIIDVPPDFFNFEYRSSILKRNKRYFLISAKFDILKKVDNFFTEEFRFKNQPKGFNCGSVFKNPIEWSAGKFIDEAWLKWWKIWWAEISEIHANFITSDWTATYMDILNLINHIKNVVFEKFSVRLEEEINIFY